MSEPQTGGPVTSTAPHDDDDTVDVDRTELYKSVCIYETGRRELISYVLERALPPLVGVEEAETIVKRLDEDSTYLTVEETDLGSYDVLFSGVTTDGVEVTVHVLCDPGDESMTVLTDDPLTVHGTDLTDEVPPPSD